MGSSSGLADLEKEWEHLRLEEDSGGLALEPDDDIPSVDTATRDFRFCMVGRFITDRPINLIAMKNTMASLWGPGKGITITDV